MDTIQCIETRRSIRKFKSESIPHTTVEKIIAAASYAPSWKNTQTTRYLVIENKELISKISKEATMNFAYNEKTISNCSAVVVVTSIAKRSGYEKDGSFSTTKNDKWEMFDAGIATQTFMLAANEYHVGTVALGIFDENKIREILSIPDSQNVSVLIAMGYADETPSMPPRKNVDELISYK